MLKSQSILVTGGTGSFGNAVVEHFLQSEFAEIRVFSRDEILNSLRGHEADLYTRAVDIVVSRLRKKLEPLDCIKTLRNAGYALALRPLSA